MRSMAQREVDSQDTVDPLDTMDLPVTQASPGTPVSQVLAEFRGLRRSPDNEAMLVQPLGDLACRDLREHEFPFVE